MTHSSPDEDQRQRFIDAARELDCEEGFDRLDEALKRVGTTPPQPHEPTAKRTRAASRPASERKQKAPK
jgi:hypothetical protein